MSQAISLSQQVDKALENMKSTTKVFQDIKAQADSLSEIIETVKSRPELHVSDINSQVGRINAIAVELRDILQVMTMRQHKSMLRQGLYALIRADRDDAKLRDVLERLALAKGHLTLQIGIINNDILGELRDSKMNHEPGMNTIYLFLRRNESLDNAKQINGAIGLESSKAPITARVIDNRAHGCSQQKNIIIGGQCFASLLEV